MSKLKARLRLPSPAMTVAVIALVLGMAGAAYAVKKIGPEGLKKNSVKTKKIVDKAVTTQKLEDEAVTTLKLDPPERSEAFVTNQASATPLSTAAGPFADTDRVASMSLPANGKYVVNASVDLASDGAGGAVTCALRDDATVVSQGGESLPASTAFAGSVALTGTVDGGTVDLVCQAQNPGQARARVITASRAGTLTQG